MVTPQTALVSKCVNRNKIITRYWGFLIFGTKLRLSKSRSLVCVPLARFLFCALTNFLQKDRKKVLKHHPDKKVTTSTPPTTTSLITGINLNTNDDAFFKCIQKAHEVLTNPEKRRQFDSADPQLLEELEEDLPTAPSMKADKHDFIQAFTPIFEREARFSKKQPVPVLGSIDASKQHVESFYDFWYNFDSWRSFEWYDKEVNEGSDRFAVPFFSAEFRMTTVSHYCSRDDKRYTEKKNKSERARRKKEDIARVRKIVDHTLR